MRKLRNSNGSLSSRFFTSFAVSLLASTLTYGAAGSLSGTVHDFSESAVAGARITLVNVALRTEFKSVSDDQGLYSFPPFRLVCTT